MTRQQALSVRAARTILELKRFRSQQISQHEEFIERLDYLIAELQNLQNQAKELK